MLPSSAYAILERCHLNKISISVPNHSTKFTRKLRKKDQIQKIHPVKMTPLLELLVSQYPSVKFSIGTEKYHFKPLPNFFIVYMPGPLYVT